MTDTPEKRVEEAALAMHDADYRQQIAERKWEDNTEQEWWLCMATAALVSSERTIAERDARIEALEAALTECADDLESEFKARRAFTHPSRYERDLEPVVRARAVLNERKQKN